MNSQACRERAMAHALGERHEGVVGARHHHAVFAGLLDLVAQQQREFEHDRLFELAAGGARAVVDAAVAGIDDDQRPRVGLFVRRGGAGGARW